MKDSVTTSTDKPTVPVTGRRSVLATRVDKDRETLVEARSRGSLATLMAYFRLSGPGWLQSAITLGGGSLSGALYLGVLGGYNFIWLQMLAIALGIIMLGAIAYVTLSTGMRPFQAINQHINPVLGWGWAIASLLASLVWCLPQFSLSVAVVQQNLMPGLLGPTGTAGPIWGKVIICGVLLFVASFIVWRYARPGRGIRLFEAILKTMVACIVLSFVGVVLKLAVSEQSLPWNQIFAGFIPDFSAFSRPANSYLPYLSGLSAEGRQFWTNAIVSRQQDVMIAAAAAAVGINMTFFLPYSILARGWDKEFKGLAIFDMATGMAIPFVAVTACVVIAAASQFHTKPGTGLLDGNQAPFAMQREYTKLLTTRNEVVLDKNAVSTASIESLPRAEKELAAMLVSRDAFLLADSLTPLTGRTVSQYLFGFGVLGMGLSTIIMLMVISGVVLREMFDWPIGGLAQRLGSLVTGIGVIGPFIWQGKAQFWLAVPASVAAMTLLPIAYFTFLLMMNSRNLLGSQMPRGLARWVWNILMIVATMGATIAAGWSVWNKAGWVGVGVVIIFISAAVVVHFTRKTNTQISVEERTNAEN